MAGIFFNATMLIRVVEVSYKKILNEQFSKVNVQVYVSASAGVGGSRG